MRAGLSTIQQTLTPEAASVLNQAIAEAGRRNHGQTTPLHVAATLLSSPSGFLRQACIRSHPNSSHPLQCRALELCFSVALERLPTAAHNAPPASAAEPPVSNALMAALKRAQAHQRRGCPEQQQQPLLAVKVELEQLIISILDDPSVSRVMREASFSSPAVKSTIEQSLSSVASHPPAPSISPSPIGLGYRPPPSAAPGRSLYLNPRLQQGGGFAASAAVGAQSGRPERGDEVKRAADVLARAQKRNPVLVGESEAEAVAKELLRRIERREFLLGEGLIKDVQVIPLEAHLGPDRTQMASRLKELGDSIEAAMGKLGGGGVVLDLGDLKWVVEQPAGFGNGCVVPHPGVPEAGRAAVAEMGRLLARFGEGSGGRLWLIGTATCETYMRCKVYHPSMENDWDLHPLPIAGRPLPPGFMRLGSNGILGNSLEIINPLKTLPTAATAPPRRASESIDPARRASCCPQCAVNYEQELAKLVAEEFERSSSGVKAEAVKPPLPLWLQNAKAQNGEDKASEKSQAKDQEILWRQKSQELQKKWSDTCLRLHPHFHQNLSSERITPTPVPIMGLYNPKLMGCQTVQPLLQVQKNIGETLLLSSNQVAKQASEPTATAPGSPVRTDLVLGPTKMAGTNTEEVHKERLKDYLGCISSEPPNSFHELQNQKNASTLDSESFKRLLKALMQKVWWQREAASSVAATVTQCKSGHGKNCSGGSKGDIWLMFTGPDRVGKIKMASVLSELVCNTNPVMLSLGPRCGGEEIDVRFRGKTALDRVAEAVHRNPFSVIMIEDVDEADAVVCGSIKQAMERGRLADSHGREISLANVIFILTSKWSPENLVDFASNPPLEEVKLARVAGGNWQLKLSVCEKTGKRRANWLLDEDRQTKLPKEMTSAVAFDLNLAADAIHEDAADGSRNSSDLTVDHEDERGLELRRCSTMASIPSRQLHKLVDDAIVFKPVDFTPIRRDIATSITSKFSAIIGEVLSLEVEGETLEKILGGVWLGRTGLEEWMEKVIIPSFHQLKSKLPPIMPDAIVRLELDEESGSRGYGEWLPNRINVVVDELGV